MPHFTIEKLKAEQLHEAWPVIRMSGLHASPDWWLGDAAELIERGGGVLVARTPRSGIHGVAAYDAPGEQPANMLAVQTFITLELSRGSPVKRALYAALEEIATKLGCSDVALPLHVKHPYAHS